MGAIREVLGWYLWGRWTLRWKMRRMTEEERGRLAWEYWQRFLEAVKDVPQDRPLIEVVDSMNDFKKRLDAGEYRVGE